jgi:hypothetical protein
MVGKAEKEYDIDVLAPEMTTEIRKSRLKMIGARATLRALR